MATDVPVQLDGVSQAKEGASEDPAGSHRSHREGKHSKRSRSRDGKDKDKHRSKHRKRSKSEHRSSERRERHGDVDKSPAGARLQLNRCINAPQEAV